MARMIGNDVVLPDLPYSPDVPTFPEVSLTRDTLPAHNAMVMLGQGLTSSGPRPSAPVINLPQFNIPQGSSMTEMEVLMGGGFGQGIVPNSPRPAPAQVHAAQVSLNQDYLAKDYDLAEYSNSWNGLSPQAQYLKPTSPLEIYNFQSGPDVSGLITMKPEKLMSKINAHQPQANTGGDPVFEAEAVAIRPTNPREFMGTAPSFNIPQTPKSIPVRDLPVMPASTQPRVPNFAKMVGPARPIVMEAQYVAPPVRNADMGGMLNSTSKVGGVANFNGRNVGSSL